MEPTKGNEKWQQFLSDQPTTPNIRMMGKLKRKWFKKNIDPDFDVDWDPDARPCVGES